MNWGYAICDAAIRAHYLSGALVPTTFPFANGVG
jgi:hypothetical protein